MIEQCSAHTLTDEEINELLDQHLFQCRPLCLGLFVGGRCQWCGAIDDRAIASRVFDELPWHRRLAPYYRPAEIVAKMAEQSRSAQIVFAMAARTMILGDSMQAVRRSPLTEFMQLLFNVNGNVRAVGIAALVALKIVDEQGIVREQ